MKDHYETLGVVKTSTQDEIKRAFRSMAKKHHPDAGGSQEEFAKISSAYEILGDPQKRAEYDSPSFNNFGFDHQSNGFHFDFSNIFEQALRRNKTVRTFVTLDFLETLKSKSMTISIPLTTRTETHDIEVPPGVENGQVVVIQGYGDDTIPGIPRGNLEIVFQVQPHNDYVKVGNNLVTKKSISCIEAMTGTSIKVVLPFSGSSVSINIPPGSQHNSQFGIPDEGFPMPGSKRGKFILHLNIIVPKLTAEQINNIKQLGIV